VKKNFTNSQAKRMLDAIQSKAQRLTFANHKTVQCMTTQDMIAIEKIVQRCMKRIP
jgi:hypothetical protein